MIKISIVAASGDRLAAIRDVLPCDVAADYLRLQDLQHEYPRETAILDVDLVRSDEVQAVKAWLAKRSSFGKVIVCIDSGASYLHVTQARALGATAIVARPVQASHLRAILLGRGRSPALAEQPSASDPASDINAIADMFAAVRNGERPGIEHVAYAGAQLVDRLTQARLPEYLAAIRRHHSRTYTHCLTVTAVAVAFGMHLGFSRNDTERLAVAGLLHDIGKSQIPFEILEKPAALDPNETALMQIHPEIGYEILRGLAGLPDDTADMVLHHHEYLDGSGYPHGLRGSQISDLNRLMTIADVFGALIEPRSYKPPMSGMQALDVLRGMGPKLDATLVRVFAPLAGQFTD